MIIIIVFNLIRKLKLKVILNLIEWEITLDLNEFDESWMRYALGRVSDTIILNSRFQSKEIGWNLFKGFENLMVKIGDPSMSEAFEPPEQWWVKSKSTLYAIEEYFNGDWQKGQEISKVTITQRLYQISPYSKQAWFSNSSFISNHVA